MSTPTNFSISAASELTGRDRRTLKRYLADVKPSATKGTQPLWTGKQVVDAIVAGELKLRPAHNARQINLSDEKALLAREQRARVARENLVASGKYVDVEEAGVEVERLFSVVRERLLGIPGAIAYDLVIGAKGEAGIDAATIVLRQKLEDALYEALEEISSPELVVAKISTATFPTLAMEGANGNA